MYYVLIGALNCIIKRRLYRGKLSFLPCEPESTEQSTAQTNDNTDSQEQTNDSTDPQEQTDRSEQEPSDKPQEEQSETSEERKVDVTIDIEEEREEVEEGGTNRDTTEQTGTGEEQADDPETSLPASAQAEAQATTDPQSEHSTADSAPSAQDATQQEDFSQFGPKADLLPSLLGPIPENWETIERDFMAVTLLMIPHMAHNFFGDPAFSIGTGKIRVVIIDGQISRLGMFGLLTKADTGDHLEMNGVLRKDVMAFRFEPHTAPGMLTIDGEEVYYGPLQCQIHPTLARVMCRKRRV